MSEAAIIERLREVEFLEGFDQQQLEKLAAISREASFSAGQTLFREGDPAEDVYLLLRGNAILEICAAGIGCRRIMTVAPGELLGWSPVLQHTRLTATARAVGPVEAAVINGKTLLTLCAHQPEFGYEFMRRVAMALAKRLSATRMQLLDVYGPEAGTATKTE